MKTPKSVLLVQEHGHDLVLEHKHDSLFFEVGNATTKHHNHNDFKLDSHQDLQTNDVGSHNHEEANQQDWLTQWEILTGSQSKNSWSRCHLFEKVSYGLFLFGKAVNKLVAERFHLDVLVYCIIWGLLAVFLVSLPMIAMIDFSKLPLKWQSYFESFWFVWTFGPPLFFTLFLMFWESSKSLESYINQLLWHHFENQYQQFSFKTELNHFFQNTFHFNEQSGQKKQKLIPVAFPYFNKYLVVKHKDEYTPTLSLESLIKINRLLKQEKQMLDMGIEPQHIYDALINDWHELVSQCNQVDFVLDNPHAMACLSSTQQAHLNDLINKEIGHNPKRFNEFKNALSTFSNIVSRNPDLFNHNDNTNNIFIFNHCQTLDCATKHLQEINTALQLTLIQKVISQSNTYSHKENEVVKQ